ncbi:MAG: Rieske (2Fe-2S) protein [Salinigranum sp.]
MTEYVVAEANEVAEGERLVVQLDGKDIGVFNVGGEYYAYLSWCLHQGGPCCEGLVTGTPSAVFDRDSLETTLEWSREDEILNCPWHGWEYDIVDGTCISDSRYKLPSYPIREEDGELIVEM